MNTVDEDGKAVPLLRQRAIRTYGVPLRVRCTYASELRRRTIAADAIKRCSISWS